MTAGPVSEHDWTIHSLNVQGIFFQRWCQKTIEDSNVWKVRSVNYPVAFGQKESTLDIRAEVRSGDRIFNLLIECKKNNPDFINWIFFPKYQAPTNLVMFNRIINLPRPPPKFGWEVDSGMQMLQSGYPIADEARETRGSYVQYAKGDKTKTSNAAIQDAAYQITLATQAICRQEHLFSTTLGGLGSPPSMPWKEQLFLSTVVTSADIFACDFDPSDVDSATGEISYEKVTVKEVPYIYYEYPLPPHLQFPPDDLVYTLKTIGSLEFLVRKHILIVHSGKFTDFLGELATQAELFFSPPA